MADDTDYTPGVTLNPDDEPDLAPSGRPRFYWEQGPFSHADLPTIATDIMERMSEEEVRLAVLSINTTSLKAVEEKKARAKPRKDAQKAKERALIEAARVYLEKTGVSVEDVTLAYMRQSGNSTPQQELEKIQAEAQRSPQGAVPHASLAEITAIGTAGVALYCPVCDKDITGTCPTCGYNGE